ncbi:hypothetical protein BCR42DRAFT_447393 [Absidia repens]|uniref:Uncharacterized protein n=1 Tax=Absidia repens TaxID=90262 RepID=A0A1X2ITH0_9FUNG|nr:hypothetical protein BCR42DRAFT_447393 [Absidia repens]
MHQQLATQRQHSLSIVFARSMYYLRNFIIVFFIALYFIFLYLPGQWIFCSRDGMGTLVLYDHALLFIIIRLYVTVQKKIDLL